MKHSIITFALAVAASTSFALDSLDDAIQLTGVTFQQDMATRDVVVNYTLSGNNAIIRADILTNDVSIGKANIKTFTGDYSATMTDVITPGPHSFRWKARNDWPDQLVGNLKVKLCAFYPEEANSPSIYDNFAQAVLSNDFSADPFANGWTKQLGGCTGEFAAIQNGVLVICDGASAATAATAVTTPAFEGLDQWRIALDFGVKCTASIDWEQYWTRWQYYISGLDADGNEVFKLVGTANARGTGVASTIGGVTIPGDGTKVHLTLLRNSANTFSVFGPNGLGTAAATISNPNGKLAKLRFTILAPTSSPAASGYGYIDNLVIEDISAAPF